jgi:hypothetical protein
MTSRYLLSVVIVFLVTQAIGQDELEKRATWNIPTTAEVKARLDDHLATKKLDETTRLKIDALWPDEAEQLPGRELLDRLTDSLAVVEPKAAEIVTACRQDSPLLLAPQFAALEDEAIPEWARHNLRLLVGRWLAQHDLIDESLEVLKDVKLEHAVDPATLLFYQAIAQHRLLKKDECLTTVAKLMEHEAEIPHRYVTLARLMEADIKPLKTDSLDEIARLMDDIRRRLALARAGKVVRDEEDTVIKKLEKMIDDLEKKRQQQQQQKQQSSSKSSRRPGNPLEQSQRADLKGPGEVDPKNIGKQDGWGNMPPKQRQEVLQQIGRELPAHFRETIEEYFKRLARDESP